MNLNFAKRLLWFTDTHLNYVPWSKKRLVKHIHKEAPSGVIISGDISSGSNLLNDLTYLANNVLCPVYIVCGNHDAWFNSFDTMQSTVREVCNANPHISWLTDHEQIQITDDTCLIGADGWYDVAIGNPNVTVLTGDWMAIDDLRTWPFSRCIDRFRSLAEQSVIQLEGKLINALERYKTVYLVTHVPPWSTEVDRQSFFKHYFLPYNANIGLGKMIEETMSRYVRSNLIVLSGHTHASANIKVAANIECRVGVHGVGNKNAPLII
jgi:predicted phosphohydrolase